MSDKLTWRELKAIANEVPEELLDIPVTGWHEDDGETPVIEITGFEILDEDYLDDGDSGICPESIMKNSIPAEEFTEEDFPVIHKKGTRILQYK